MQTAQLFWMQLVAKKIPLAPRGVLAPVSVHAGPSAQPPLGTSGIFLAYVSAELPSNISPNPSEVISEDSELYDISFRMYLKLADFPVKIGLIGGVRGSLNFFYSELPFYVT